MFSKRYAPTVVCNPAFFFPQAQAKITQITSFEVICSDVTKLFPETWETLYFISCVAV